MDSPSLRELQRWMKSHIQPGALAPPKKDSNSFLNPQRGDPGEVRLSVYAEGYLIRIREALAEVYEAIHHVLGDQVFTEMAKAYAEKHPSHDYNLSLAGRHLPEFLASSPLTGQLPFLPDLARLEWSVCQAFHASDQPPLDASRLQALSTEDWDRARLVFQPSVAVVNSSWPILDIWEARKQPRESIDIDLINRPQCILVYRRGVQVRCERIDPRHYTLLERLCLGKNLAETLGEAARGTHSTSLPISEWFSHWVEQGLLRGVLPTSADPKDI